MKIATAAMIGVGAVGGVYGKLLHETYPGQFMVIAEGKRRERIEMNGISVNNESYFPRVSDVKKQETVDLIIVGVKNYDLEQALIDVKNHVSENTIFLPLLNGITASERIQKAYPNNRVLLGLSMGIDAIRTEDTIIYTQLGVVQFGYANNTAPEKEVLAIDDFLRSAGIVTKVCEDMMRMLWRKWMLNVGVNQASAITGAKFKYLAQVNELLTIFQGAMLEVLQIAEAASIHLTKQDVDDITSFMLTFQPEGKTSMLQDVEAKRRTEIDYFAGTVLEYGKKYSIATPINEMLYLSLKAKEKVYLLGK